jgi:hypothetical protein
MNAQTTEPILEKHPNALLIEKLYIGIQRGNLAMISACYDEAAYFEDIAFQRRRRTEILEMWRYVCHGHPRVTFDTNDISADDRKGSGRWSARYIFGQTKNDPGRPVNNHISSTFLFRDNLIIEHRDHCDPMTWARQAVGFPFALALGLVTPLRRYIASRKLRKFLKKTGQD